jgi:hypothetical protein
MEFVLVIEEDVSFCSNLVNNNPIEEDALSERQVLLICTCNNKQVQVIEFLSQSCTKSLV